MEIFTLQLTRLTVLEKEVYYLKIFGLLLMYY